MVLTLWHYGKCFYKYCEMFAWDTVSSTDYGAKHFINDIADSRMEVSLYFKYVCSILGDAYRRFRLGTIDCISTACQFFVTMKRLTSPPFHCVSNVMRLFN